MNKNLLQIIGITTFVAGVALSAQPVFADSYGGGSYGTPCNPTSYGGTTYGGSTPCPISTINLNKTVQNPQTGAFVDNLGVNDPMYNPGQNVTFHLDITNVGTQAVSNVVVKDTLPQYLTFVSGEGSFDNNSQTLTDTIANLNPNETKEITVVATFAGASALPQNQVTTCVINTATAQVNGQQLSDTAQACVEKQAQTTKGGLPILPPSKNVKTTPPTGPEAFGFLGLLGSAISGLIIRKKAIR